MMKNQSFWTIEMTKCPKGCGFETDDVRELANHDCEDHIQFLNEQADYSIFPLWDR